MLIATSLMYSTDEYEIQKQLKAIQTWKNMGFEVISCNVAEEIKLLQPFFQEITFVELARSGKEQMGNTCCVRRKGTDDKKKIKTGKLCYTI